MNRVKTLGGKTRRILGRRAITPIRRKRKLAVIKTRSRTRIDDISVLQRTSSLGDEERATEDSKEHCDSEKRKGSQGGDDSGEREVTHLCEAPVDCGYSENPEKSVHPGSIQGLPQLLESTDALTEVTNETSPQEEEPPF